MPMLSAVSQVSPERRAARNRKRVKALIYHLFVSLLGFAMLYPVLWLFARRVDPRLGRDHRVAEGHLRAVRAAGERPAVAVDAFGVPVVQLGEGVGVAGTERVDQTAVIHVTDSNK